VNELEIMPVKVEGMPPVIQVVEDDLDDLVVF
jgi:hypothetical protein